MDNYKDKLFQKYQKADKGLQSAFPAWLIIEHQALETEVKELKAEIRKDVLHWHELFGEHLTPESKKDENFMLGYYSGRKDQALKYAKDLEIKEELNQAQEGETICPECMEPTPQQELDMFGGLCENCTQEGESDE